MSTSFTSTVIYGYCLSRHELERRKPNPFWGKHTFNPDTGQKVEKYIEEDVDLKLDVGDKLPSMTKFTRFDTSCLDNADILLGIQLDEMNLSNGPRDSILLDLLSPGEQGAVYAEVKKLLDKAGVAFDPERMGYYLAGYVG